MKKLMTTLLITILIVLSGCTEQNTEPIDQQVPLTAFETIQDAMDNIVIPDTVEDIVLPVNYGNVSISWTSNIDGTITTNGRLIQSGEDQVVSLTGLFSYRDKELTRLYTTTILASDQINQDLIDLNTAMNQITFTETTVIQDLVFVSSLNDVTINWQSDNTSCIDNVGNVHRPSENDGDCTATITTTFIKGQQADTKTFTFIVSALTTTVNYTGYYEGIDGLSGSALVDELFDIIHDGFDGVTYGDARYILDETDQDPNNPNNVILVYLQESRSGEWNCVSICVWNREHVWPQSYLDSTADNGTVNSASDLQNLKPSDPSENSSRSNLPFGTTGSTYEPPDVVKGDIARIVFYMSIMYDMNLELVGEVSIFLSWNEQDPVDDFERNRNDIIFSYQGNRNPFIDHPELAELIWSN